jgi:hypothetical protein
MAVLNDVHDAAALTPDQALHLEACTACRTAVERMRRMVSAWTADQADEDAVAAAAARFHARKATARAAAGWLDVVPFASAGVAAGYLLLAATGTISLPWRSRPVKDALPPVAARPSSAAAASAATESAPRYAPVFASSDEGAKWVRARPHIETVRGVAPLVNGLRLELQRGETARVALSDGHASSVEGPCLVEFWSTPLEVGGWRMTREESAAPPNAGVETPAGTNIASPPLAAPSESSSAVEGAGIENAVPSKKASAPGTRERGAATALNETVNHARDQGEPSASVGSVRAWATAAAALREDDFDAADRAFDELGHAADPATRDAARLARAQLWIAHGRETAVRPVLEQLAESGATALVRQRAAEFLYR